MQTNKTQADTIKIHTLDPFRWVTNYADYLYRYANIRINDEELAKDLVQETFLAALEKVEKFEGRSSERTWLTAILKNKVIDIYRKKSSGNNPTKVEENGYDQETFFDAEDGHWRKEHQPKVFGIEEYDPLSKKEFHHILRECMKRLPALWLSVFSMKHMDDKDTETICAELKITASNFWVIIHRSKVNLRSCLQKNWI